MLDKDTINNMKNQIKVSKVQSSNLKNKIINSRGKANPFKVLIPITACFLFIFTFYFYISDNKITNENKSLLPFSINVYAKENDYLDENYITETSKVELKENIEIKLAKYNKAMSIVPGIPIEFKFDQNSDVDYLKIEFNNGVILDWNMQTGKITNKGNKTTINSTTTLYFSPNGDGKIKIYEMKDDKVVSENYINLTTDKDYNFFAKLYQK